MKRLLPFLIFAALSTAAAAQSSPGWCGSSCSLKETEAGRSFGEPPISAIADKYQAWQSGTWHSRIYSRMTERRGHAGSSRLIRSVDAVDQPELRVKRHFSYFRILRVSPRTGHYSCAP